MSKFSNLVEGYKEGKAFKTGDVMNSKERQARYMGKFKTKARAIELLGKKQIRDSVTALSELMKNSYDADAEELRVEFNTSVESIPYIAIYDTGVGMNSLDIEDKWLVLGTEAKKVNKQSTTPKGRVLMGEKGIGRLAVAKLGQQTILLSKKENTKWNIVYLNWNLFENPYFMIEEIVIPASYDVKTGEIPGVLSRLIEEQKTNLNSDNWNVTHIAKTRNITFNQEEELLEIPELREIRDLKLKIEEQIKKLTFPIEEIMDMCDFIESGSGHGTILLSFDLNENWDNYLDAKTRDSNQKSMDERRYDRFAAFISDFQHADKEFIVEVFFNGQIQKYNYDYNEEDYKKYDLKVEGKIRNGCFWGSLEARNADEKVLQECNLELAKGLNVTAGINNWKDYDCGEFDVKFCHVELMEKNTGLTKEEFDDIKKKMSISGGIAVYRDNMRILPYGEVGNDFLELERQRTGRAGDFIFSFRNTFGRIDLSLKNNPLLEDKSSREGLIENEQYFYFLSTLQNLLTRLSNDFLNGKTNSKNLRDTYVGYNNHTAEEKKKKEEAEKEEEKREKDYVQDLRKQLKSNLQDSKPSFKNIEFLIGEMLKPWQAEADSYTYWSNQKDKLKKSVREINKQINLYKKLTIQVNERYRSSINEEDMEAIHEFNKKIKTDVEYFTDRSKDYEQRQRKYIDQSLSSWVETASGQLESSPLEYIGFLRKQILELNHTLQEYEEDIKADCKEREVQIMQKFESFSNFQLQITQLKKKYSKELTQERTHVNKQMGKLLSQCDELTQLSAVNVSEIEKEIVKETTTLEKELQQFIFSEQVKMQNEYDHFSKQADMLTFYLQDENIQETQQLLGVLKEKNIELQKELDTYYELANTGLAADIVNHEFNQLFTNVYDAIKQMRFQQMSSDAKYYLKEIEIGFRAISSRQSQLSPMYRSRSTNKKNINMRNMIADLQLFFKDKLKDNGITFINDIPEDVEILISESGIYPVISNLIYNSLYWLADRGDKEILVHYEQNESALYVEDSGCGIETRNLERVFEPFFSLKRIPRGLGLTISRKVLEKQGHAIRAINEGEKKRLNGACFVITFHVNSKN